MPGRFCNPLKLNLKYKLGWNTPHWSESLYCILFCKFGNFINLYFWQAEAGFCKWDGLRAQLILRKNEYYLCLVSGDRYISEDKLSKKIGEDIKKADAEECKQITGFSIGGVAPVAHLNKPKLVLIDKNLDRFEMLYAAAGHPYVVFGITYNNLCLITGGKIEDIVL